MLVLRKIACFQFIVIAKLKNCPVSGTEVLQIGKGFTQELHCQRFKLLSESLPGNFVNRGDSMMLFLYKNVDDPPCNRL